MLVLAPAACIMSGIALSSAFDVFTRSIKFASFGKQADVSVFVVVPKESQSQATLIILN